MNVEAITATASSICITGAAIGAGFRWASRFSHVMHLVEARSKQLEANGGQSLRDDVREIRAAVDAHTNEFAAIHQTVSALAVMVAGNAAAHRIDEGS
jgi:hypothetical protein